MISPKELTKNVGPATTIQSFPTCTSFSVRYPIECLHGLVSTFSSVPFESKSRLLQRNPGFGRFSRMWKTREWTTFSIDTDPVGSSRKSHDEYPEFLGGKMQKPTREQR
jgi:hypothetical protein